nr:disease resistance protein RPM1-like [Ipomoea batatas]
MDDNDSAMPIIGVYVAAASLACSFAMFLSSCLAFINSFPKFNVRFSRNIFALNATWLTLLAVAIKLAGDVSTPKWSLRDIWVKNMSTIFLTVAMGNFFTSLGSMSNTDILTNVTALSILVITVLVDLCIEIRTHVFDPSSPYDIIFKIALLFCTWISIVCSALAVPAIKKRAESKYQKLAASDYEKQQMQQGHTIEELRLSITKYWVMAASGCPRSLMKRLVTFGFTSMMCVLSSLNISVGLGDYEYWNCGKESDYKWSIDFIFYSQFYALYPSALIITVFLIGVLRYKYEENGIKISREEFTIAESYWTEKLVEWRQTSMSMRWFKRRAVRKLIHNIKEFDSNRVPSLLSSEPPNCWTLPIVTLTSIAIAIPDIASQHVDWLVSSVNEGLRYASLIDVLDEKCGLKGIKKAADVVWVGVELHKKWFDMDLERKIGEISSIKDIVQDLVDVAERIVMKFSSKENIILVENPLYWPANVLAANSMYRIARTILLYFDENGECQAEELFRKVICMIADILTACLTNFGHMIAALLNAEAMQLRKEDVIINKNEVIRLWIAEGFVREIDQQVKEEVAEGYLNELLHRNLIQIAKETRGGRMSGFQVHNIIREIILSKSIEQNFAIIATRQNTKSFNELRRLAIHKFDGNILGSTSSSNMHLRSLQFFEPVSSLIASFSLSKLLTTSFIPLKVLNLTGAQLEEIPEEVFSLFQLKYLSLRGTNLRSVSKSIGRLQNLETLDLKWTSVTEFPTELLQLCKLRHLLVYNYGEWNDPWSTIKSFSAPFKIGELLSLQKLCFIKADDIGDSKIVSEIGKLTQLRRLAISNLKQEDAKEMCLSLEKLTNLCSLSLATASEDAIIDIQHPRCLYALPGLRSLYLGGCLERVPQWLSSLEGLTRLNLVWNKLPEDPLPFIQDLPMLIYLEFYKCYETEGLCFKKFSKLKIMYIRGFEALKWIRIEEGALANLARLHFSECELLEEVPLGIQHLSNMEEISFYLMADKLIASVEPSGENYAKISHIPNISYTKFTNGKAHELAKSTLLSREMVAL